MLLIGAPVSDRAWTFQNRSQTWLSPSAIRETSIVNTLELSGLYLPAPSKHTYFNSLRVFNKIRVHVYAGGGVPINLDFTFQGINTAQNLMFTSQNYLEVIPSAMWAEYFGGMFGGQYQAFERAGDCSNNPYPCTTPRPRCARWPVSFNPSIMFGFQGFALGDGGIIVTRGLGSSSLPYLSGLSASAQSAFDNEYFNGRCGGGLDVGFASGNSSGLYCYSVPTDCIDLQPPPTVSKTSNVYIWAGVEPSLVSNLLYGRMK